MAKILTNGRAKLSPVPNTSWQHLPYYDALQIAVCLIIIKITCQKGFYTSLSQQLNQNQGEIQYERTAEKHQLNHCELKRLLTATCCKAKPQITKSYFMYLCTRYASVQKEMQKFTFKLCPNRTLHFSVNGPILNFPDGTVAFSCAFSLRFHRY